MAKKYFMGDFETTVYDGQERTDVWAFGLMEMFKEDGLCFNNIYEGWNYLLSLKEDIVLFFHNLKFDGSFVLHMLNKIGYKQALKIMENDRGDEIYSFDKDKEMKNETYKYMISNRGQWYWIKVKVNNHMIEIRDSVKLLPFSVERMGKDFNLSRRKTTIDYKFHKAPFEEISEKEKGYLMNDLIIPKEGLEMMFNDGHRKITIGSCCLSEYRKLISNQLFNEWFPNLTEITFDELNLNMDEYIRKSYRGAFCYVNEFKQCKILYKGITLDVNSLYPYVMHSMSGNRYPIGKPIMTWTGNYIPYQLGVWDETYYFIRIRCRFYLRDGYLPFIQIKNSFLYNPREHLKTSDPKIDGKYVKSFSIGDKVYDGRVTMTLTKDDYKLLLEHYYLDDFEILDGVAFDTEIGIFDKYLNKYMEQKMNSEGAKREEAKLFQTNLYGKISTGTDSSFKVIYFDDDVLKFKTQTEFNKKTVHIACGSTIISKARCMIIRIAQMNYHKDGKGFCYCDTDSLHCDCSLDELKGIEIDNKIYGKFKNEMEWDEAIFVRQKTYIERNEKECSIKCAGMPERPKNLLLRSMGYMGDKDFEDKVKNVTQDELDFISVKRNISDFKIGLRVPGCLKAKQIKGGVVLFNGEYEMK